MVPAQSSASLTPEQLAHQAAEDRKAAEAAAAQASTDRAAAEAAHAQALEHRKAGDTAHADAQAKLDAHAAAVTQAATDRAAAEAAHAEALEHRKAADIAHADAQAKLDAHAAAVVAGDRAPSRDDVRAPIAKPAKGEILISLPVTASIVIAGKAQDVPPGTPFPIEAKEGRALAGRLGGTVHG